MPPVPKHRWLMQVYAQDVLQRLDEIKATITSQYGRILKMDSTKKVARKLAGKSYGTVTWATNVGNEHGQVIMSVLTSSEGYGLGPMVEGLIKRYRMAGVAPPEVLYVDRDCCGNTLQRRMFEEWNNMTIRLDIWHFMRRFATGCSTDSHQLYATFMSRLSHCIFMWDQDDLKAVKDAKRAELEAGGRHPSEADVLHSVSRSELALHCRRITRGTEETQAQIHRLIQAFDGDAGRDSLGVPLINSARMSEIIKSQWKHVACIQDLPGVQLYAQTGSSVKGGHRLPTYRCARGSTSLESFHLHLNRFIPGTLASDTFFQAYLLDGLARWNEDRAAAATRDEQQHPHCYNHLLRHAVNTLAEEVLGKKIIPYVGPRKYTGELIGVEYLYQQTGQVLQDYKLAIQESESSEVAIEVHEGHAEPEEFQDFTVPTFHLQRLPAASSKAPSSVSPSPSTSTLSLRSVVSPPSSTSTLSSLSVVPPPSPSTSTLSSLSVVPPPSPSTSTLSSLSVVPPPSSTSTLSSLSVVPPPSPSTSTLSSQQSTSVDDCVGPDNIEGYGAVQELAEFLFGLREHLLALSGDECTKIITLWQALGDFDKRKTIYPPRHKNTLKQGRFRATKKIVAPGVESTKRCFIGAHSPAQWPDCNRVVEAIFTRLCDLYKNSVHCEGKRVSRFTMVIRVYKHIRECVITNAKVMTETTIQLPEVNVATVTQWFSRRCRSQEQQILKQGIPAPDAPMAGPEKLLLAKQKGTSLFPGSLAEPHAFVLPPNTAEQNAEDRPANLELSRLLKLPGCCSEPTQFRPKVTLCRTTPVKRLRRPGASRAPSPVEESQTPPLSRSETRTGRTAWIYRLFRPTQKTSGAESGPQKSVAHVPEQYINQLCVSISPRPTGSDSCWIFPCFRKKRKVAPCEGTEQKTPHTPHGSPAREAPCEVTEEGREKKVPEVQEEKMKVPEVQEEKKKVPEVQEEKTKVPEVQEEKKKVPEVQEEKKKVPEVQEETEKKVLEVQEEKTKVPEVQKKVPEVQEEKTKVPEVQEEKKKVPEVQEEKKKVLEVQEEKKKVPEVQEETEKVELPVIGGKKETKKKEDTNTVPIHDTSPIRKGERYVPVNEGVRGGRQDWLGFPNPGNLCYMNSSLQGLLTLKGFIRDLSQQQEVWSHLSEAEIIRRFMNIVGCHRSADRTLKCWVLLLFKKALSVRAPEFRNNRQQDAHEFLTTVLDQMRAVAPQLQDIAARLGRVYRCPVEDHLVFRMQNTRTCRSCGAGSTREEDYTNLSLKLLPGASVGDMLQSYLMETELDFRCDCGSHRSVQQPAFQTLPKVLILHVRRICFTPSMQLVKLSDPVTIFRELMVSSTEDTGWYSLVSIINHLGNNTNSGHYISDVLHPEAGLDDPSDRWLTCNDAEVTRTTGEAVCRQRRDTAFILFYQRRQVSPSASGGAEDGGPAEDGARSRERTPPLHRPSGGGASPREPGSSRGLFL
ncbi:hypothetical protein KUCAC02_033378 [Chaenocephalus aceratus]|nr:hypothetical protein KUCAC02_033378 [Chaenocephalus aceratus]